MSRRRLFSPIALLLLALAALGLSRYTAPRTLDVASFDALYARPLASPDKALRVYHLGHSLVGRDMPAMVAQLAGNGHVHHSQLGWGTSLKNHWTGGEAIAGFEVENAHDAFRPAAEALDSGEYDALVLTEMVEIRDAIRYHDSGQYLYQWVKRALKARPDIRLYLYETWHPLDDPEGWLERIDLDLERYWEGALMRPAMAHEHLGGRIHLIPAGQVMAAFVREVEARGGVPGISGRKDLFALNGEGAQDMIHFNDLGAYLVALVHYAVLYHRDPRGAPHDLLRADGAPARAPSPEAAALMQQVVWTVVTSIPRTGVAVPSQAALR